MCYKFITGSSYGKEIVKLNSQENNIFIEEFNPALIDGTTDKILALHSSDGKTLLLSCSNFLDLKYLLSKVPAYNKGNKSILLVLSTKKPCLM